MALVRKSHCKVNLLLNILGKREDGYHNLESLMQPAWIFDILTFEKAASGVSFECSSASLPTGPENLVFKAATAFLEAAGIRDGVRIFLEKNLPVAAGLGGGSANGACALLGLNELFDFPLTSGQLHTLAADLGSDVPFFLQPSAALVFGRGEIIEAVPPLVALEGRAMLIVQPGFGISTPWAYRELARFPHAQHGTPGRARQLTERLASGTLDEAAPLFYNALEAPALEKYPLLALYQEFFRENGAVSLMSGSGSSTFAITPGLDQAHSLAERFKTKFGDNNWMGICPCANPG
jgi:4-diphosphocytidyl-2-C-methyl-D-erythritol kinase